MPHDLAWVRRYMRAHPDLPPVLLGPGEEPLGPVVLVLPWPPSANHRLTPVGKGTLVRKPEVRDYGRLAELAIATQHRQQAALTGPLHTAWEFHQHDARRRDLDNLMKEIQDLCTKMQVWQDDSQIDAWSGRRFRGVAQPYIKLTITKLGQP